MLTVRKSDERGVALIMTLFLALVVAGMAVGVILMASNSSLIAKFHANEAMMAATADAGLEQGRDTLNGTPAIVPVGLGFVTLETNAAVRDANGTVIPGFTRSLFAGPNGDTTGQYGDFASVIAVISNTRGAVVVRRIQLKQDSFSRFARFFNTWGGGVMWGNQETVFGPVHSNQGMIVQTGSPGATFWGPVSVVTSVTNSGSGNWNGGLTSGAPPITFPTTTTLANLQNFATTSQTVVTGYGVLTDSIPDTRIEFVPLDLNNDGDVVDADEGFFRVWKVSAGGTQQDKRDYTNARAWGTAASPWRTGVGWPGGVSLAGDPNYGSQNCGGTLMVDSVPGIRVPRWFRADSIPILGPTMVPAWGASAIRDSIRSALRSPGRRCYLGGDPRLYTKSNAGPVSNTQTVPQTVLNNAFGTWQNWAGWGGAPPASIQNALIASGVPAGSAAAVGSTYWPLTRAMNPNFKGIIYVNGSVAVSGLLRGRVTLVATGLITLADDITYTVTPGTNCWDILGVLSQRDIYYQNNNVNGVFKNNSLWTGLYDESPNETFDGFFLTLGALRGEYYTAPAEPLTTGEQCAGTSRGCKVLVGGTIQQSIAATYTGTTGWAEQDTYDGCGVTNPPPYYPTTGRFTKNRYYEIDPVGFNVATWFTNNQ
ncbi:MAG: hypothetical protein ABI679_04450 [Gemmatimonadota bacterium]